MIPVKNPSELDGLYMKATFDENGRVVVETNAAGVLCYKLAYESYCAACNAVGLHQSQAAQFAQDLQIAFRDGKGGKT